MREVFIPVMGMAPDDVVLLNWLKPAGAAVSVGDAVAVVETSKAELEIEADTAGILGRRLFAERDTITPGTTITHILDPGEADPETGGRPAAVVDADSSPNEVQPTIRADLAAERPRHRASPRQRRLDALAATSGGVSDGPTSAQPGRPDAADRFRAAVSASVSRSWQEIPHFTVTRELRVGPVIDVVASWRAVLPALTLTDLLLRALALAMLERERRSDLDVGLAVATERGVAIPVVRDVLSLGMVELVDARAAAVRRARAGRLSPDDGTLPVITLSNLGAAGVDQFTGVVPYGQTGLLTVGRAAPRAVVDADGALVAAVTMYATLNVDHRSWDGLPAAQVLDRLAHLLRDSASLLLNAASAARPDQEKLA